MSSLTVENLDLFYEDFQAIFDLSLKIETHKIVAILGANGAGKSSLLKAIMGMVPNKRGNIDMNNESIFYEKTYAIVNRGISMIPEGRMLFPSLTVKENLLVSGLNPPSRDHTQTSRKSKEWDLDRVLGLFPDLKKFLSYHATQLSGGQQQMVAIGRALAANPSILLCDELSLGLAPTIINQIYEVLPHINKENITIVLVEQDIKRALTVADYFYCLCEGRITYEGLPQECDMEQLQKAYFGI